MHRIIFCYINFKCCCSDKYDRTITINCILYLRIFVCSSFEICLVLFRSFQPFQIVIHVYDFPIIPRALLFRRPPISEQEAVLWKVRGWAHATTHSHYDLTINKIYQ
jgi:hypothetical protein